MVQGVDKALELFKQAGMPYYRLYEGFEIKPSNCFSESTGHDTTDITSTAKKVEEILRMLAPGKYLLSARSSIKQAQDSINIKFDIPYAYGQQPAISGVGTHPAQLAGYVPKAEMELELQKLKNEYAISDLKREFEEFKKKKEPKPSAMDNFLEKHGAVIMGFLANRFMPGGAQVGLQGFTDQHQQADPAQQQGAQQLSADEAETNRKLEWAIDQLAQREGSQAGAVELIYKFAHFANQNPGTYDQFKPMILATKEQP